MVMKLTIGEAEAFRRPEDWSVTPDDRQEIHKTIDGVVVEDYGHKEDGDVISTTVLLSYPNYVKVYNYWENRTKVKVVDASGRTWENMRVVIKSDTYVNRHESFHKVSLELWRA